MGSNGAVGGAADGATRLPPRIVVAGTHSGVGKTTVATGLMAALRRRGLAVASAKVGPDYIDPGYHALATGRVPRNLDVWMSGPATVPALAGRAGRDAEVLVVEGVMGLFDGAGEPIDDAADAGAESVGSGRAETGRTGDLDGHGGRDEVRADERDDGSTAHVARLIDAPVLLVVDAAAMSTSVAALVQGYATYDPRVRVVGVVLNRVGSAGHEELLREALAPAGPPVVGAVRSDDAIVWRDRHLGLVPVAERPRAVAGSLDRLAAHIERAVDLEAVVRLARSAPDRTVPLVPLPVAGGHRVRIALAAGPAFSFSYADNVEALTAAGADLVPFDPLTADRLPEGSVGLLAGGGFPEEYGEPLAANAPLLADVARRVRGGVVTWAECGGLLWLAASLGGRPMAGVVRADATMTDRLTIGYRTARTRVVTPLGPPGTVLRGHEFHRSTTEPPGDALDLAGRFGRGRAGFGLPGLLASYVHLHLGAAPDLAAAFVRSAAADAAAPGGGAAGADMGG